MSRNISLLPKTNLCPLGSDITSFGYSPSKLLNSSNFAWNRKQKSEKRMSCLPSIFQYYKEIHMFYS